MENIDILKKGTFDEVPLLLSSKTPYNLTPAGTYNVTPDKKQIEVRYFEKAGKCHHNKELHFTNFDYEFPSSTVIKEAFEEIKESPDKAVLRDIQPIYTSNFNFQNRLKPILEGHLQKVIVNEEEDITDIVEARIHSSNGNKGSFRVFMKWYSKGSVIHNQPINKDLLVVVMYDPFHLVFPDDRHKINSYNQVKGNDKALCDRYYSYIPKEYRIDFI